MKWWGKIFFLSLLVFIIPASVWSKQTLHVYNWWNYFGENTLKNFEQEYDVNIVYESYKSNEEMLKRLVTGGDKIYDVVFPTDNFIDILKKMKLIAPLERTRVPNMAHIRPDFLNQDFDPQNKYSLPYQWGITVVIYRNDKVKISNNSLAVIFDPTEELRGKIGLVNSMREIIGTALMYKGHSINTKDHGELMEAKEVLFKMKPYVGAIETDLMPKMIDGSLWVSITWQGEAAMLAQSHPEISFFIPDEGVIVGHDSMAIPANAPNKKLAHIFINYLLDPKVSAEISNDIFYNSPVTLAAEYISNETVKKSVATPLKDLFAKYDHFKNLDNSLTEYNKVWREFKR